MFLYRFDKKYSYSSDNNTRAQEHKTVKQLSGNIVNMQIIAFCFYYTTPQLFWNPIVVVSNSFIDDNIFMESLDIVELVLTPSFLTLTRVSYRYLTSNVSKVSFIDSCTGK